MNTRNGKNGAVGPKWVPAGTLALLASLILPGAYETAQGAPREELVPILGVTMEDKPIGTVAYVGLSFEKRNDEGGLSIHFGNSPGRFSRMAQTSIEQAIRRAAHSLDLSPDSWSIALSVPYRNLTIYGESLSAMVGLSVMAMARGEAIPSDTVMTGTVTPDGHIGPVGSVPLKVRAANRAHIRRVIVPEEQDAADGDWHTPFLMQVSPVGSVTQAYLALIGRSSIP